MAAIVRHLPTIAAIAPVLRQGTNAGTGLQARRSPPFASASSRKASAGLPLYRSAQPLFEPLLRQDRLYGLLRVLAPYQAGTRVKPGRAAAWGTVIPERCEAPYPGACSAGRGLRIGRRIAKSSGVPGLCASRHFRDDGRIAQADGSGPALLVTSPLGRSPGSDVPFTM